MGEREIASSFQIVSNISATWPICPPKDCSDNSDTVLSLCKEEPVFAIIFSDYRIMTAFEGWLAFLRHDEKRERRPAETLS